MRKNEEFKKNLEIYIIDFSINTNKTIFTIKILDLYFQ